MNLEKHCKYEIVGHVEGHTGLMLTKCNNIYSERKKRLLKRGLIFGDYVWYLSDAVVKGADIGVQITKQDFVLSAKLNQEKFASRSNMLSSSYGDVCLYKLGGELISCEKFYNNSRKRMIIKRMISQTKNLIDSFYILIVCDNSKK